MSEQPRSVPPQQLGESLGRKKQRRSARPLPVAVSAAAPPEVGSAEADSNQQMSTPQQEATQQGTDASLTAMKQVPEAPTEPPAPEGERLRAVSDVDVDLATERTATPESPVSSEEVRSLQAQDVEVASLEAAAAALPQPAARRARTSPSGGPGSRSRSAASGRRAQRAPAKIGRPKSASAASSRAEDHLSASTAVYVPLEVRDLVSARRRQLDPAPTTAEVVLRAIEAQYERLPQLVQEAMRPQTGSLFTFATPARTNEVKVQMGLRLTRGQLRIMDQIEEQVGASSRGQLVTLAVRAELGTD